ncbi:hypothetical protein [Flavobacterium aciduliphilum]|uniref:hypothetical protein n=1 Tax=Flavobacterium aciduliphilum TaxID=1101402 RepID=UPI0011BDA5FC|nr:hypothetical protein [Flavobacterium aciduliphilum]
MALVPCTKAVWIYAKTQRFYLTGIQVDAKAERFCLKTKRKCSGIVRICVKTERMTSITLMHPLENVLIYHHKLKRDGFSINK